MKRAPRPGLLLVATRELRWMRRDGLALFLVIGVPVIAFALLAFTFSNAVIRNLRVTVVDADRTPTSMTYVQAIGSAPGVKVAERSDDLQGAMHAIRSGVAIAAVYIPPDFERDLLARKRPQIVAFYNRQYFTPGNSAASAITNAINAATGVVAPPRRAAFAPGFLAVEQYVLTNPALNYAQFLLRAVLPMVLHVVVAIAGGYAVGSEFSRRSLKTWLRTAGGSPLAALVGKLAPLFAIFILMMVIVAVIIHGLYHIPFRGDSLIMGAAACLLVAAYLSVGALFQLLARNLAFGLSLTAIFCSPAFGFAGVGFPILGMNEFARAWGAFLPIRWYMQILFDQAVRGLPAAISAEPFGILGALAAFYFGLTWLRLHAIAGVSPTRAAPPQVATGSYSGPGIGGAMAAEGRRVLGDRSAFGLIVLGPIFYGLLYPQPYLGQVLRGIPIAVVDQDRTELSRNLIQALNADEAIKVAVRSDTLSGAHSALGRREVFGVLGIPEGTEREVLKGNKARLPAYVDSAYFLLYNRTLQGISEAAGAVTAEVASRGARSRGSLAHAALIKSSPVELLAEPLFNPTGGYASYIVPAAFILILQQTLLMGSAALGGGYIRSGRPFRPALARSPAGPRRSSTRASLSGDARGSPLSDHSAPALWVLDAGPPPRSLFNGCAVLAVCELARPVRRSLVYASRKCGAAFYCDEPTAVLFGWRLMAARRPSPTRCERQVSSVAMAEAGQKFPVIYADPPWEFKVYSGKGKQRSAERYYDTSSVEAIKALPIGKLAAKDCVLCMWAVSPELPGALEVIKAWGFEYKTIGFGWVKQNRGGEGLFTGMGYWTRANLECCLLAARGAPMRLAMDVHQVVTAPIGEHSAKPQEVRSRIQRLLAGPYLELFAREATPGWTSWGNELAHLAVEPRAYGE